MEQGAVNPPLRRQSQCRKSKAALIYRTEFFVLGLFFIYVNILFGKRRVMRLPFLGVCLWVC